MYSYFSISGSLIESFHLTRKWNHVLCLKSVYNMDARNKISSDCYFLGMCCSRLFTFMDMGVILGGYFGGWKGNTEMP